MPLPTWYEVGQFASFKLGSGAKLSDAAKTSLSVEFEQRAAGATTGLSGLSVRYPGLSKAKLLALPAWQRMEWKGDGKLTLVTDSSFDARALSKNLKAEAWSWD